VKRWRVPTLFTEARTRLPMVSALLLCLCLESALHATAARADGPVPLRGATLYLTVSAAAPTTVPAAPAPYVIAEPRTHDYRRGSYLLAVGLGLLAGAVAHATILASVKHCGIERPNIIIDAAAAGIGLGFTYGGARTMWRTPPEQRSLSPLSKALGLPATAFATMATTLALTGFGSFVTCFEVN
jgi:hypothetical protein